MRLIGDKLTFVETLFRWEDLCLHGLDLFLEVQPDGAFALELSLEFGNLVATAVATITATVVIVCVVIIVISRTGGIAIAWHRQGRPIGRYCYHRKWLWRHTAQTFVATLVNRAGY